MLFVLLLVVTTHKASCHALMHHLLLTVTHQLHAAVPLSTI
jgi:hypothetical protein